MLAIIAFFVILFGVALLQTVLVQGQLHLDGLRAEVGERQAEAQELQNAVSAAESPAALIAAAEELGFSSDVTVTYVPGTAEAEPDTP
jgi:hypothetical protein